MVKWRGGVADRPRQFELGVEEMIRTHLSFRPDEVGKFYELGEQNIPSQTWGGCGLQQLRACWLQVVFVCAASVADPTVGAGRRSTTVPRSWTRGKPDGRQTIRNHGECRPRATRTDDGRRV